MAPCGVALSWIAQIIQCITLLLMIYIPTYGWADGVVTNVIGAVVIIGVGEIVLKYMEKKNGVTSNETHPYS